MAAPPASLADRRILITGGSSGIGLTVAEQLCRAGARVVLVARGEEGLAAAAQHLGGRVDTFAADVRDAQAIADAIAQAAERLGGLDAVVANAGAGTYGPFSDLSAADAEATVATTLLGMLHTAHAALPELERTGGTLVVVGSVAGRLPTPWLAAYTAAKHGVRGFVRSLRCELTARRSAVRVALIAPGPVDTPFWQRARTPDRRLPPELRGAYRPEAVAAEVLRALRTPGRTERTVGGLMAVAITVDALFPNFVLRPVGVAARLGWRTRHRRPLARDDAFEEPATQARREGGLLSRPSLIETLRAGRS